MNFFFKIIVKPFLDLTPFLTLLLLLFIDKMELLMQQIKRVSFLLLMENFEFITHKFCDSKFKHKSGLY